jgi:hypothetical protein
MVGDEVRIYFRKAVGYFVIDNEDLEKVSNYTWYKDCYGYPATNKYGVHLRCHQVVMGKAKDGLVTDHINRNRLDNRKNNLRFVTNAENSRNRSDGFAIRKVLKESLYGIYPRYGKRQTTYKVEFHDQNNKTTYIGSYKNLNKAVSVRDIAFELLQKGDLTPFEINKLRKSRA